MHEVVFVDRVREIDALVEFCKYFRGLPLYIYGPEGCGKTRLLRELVKRFDEFFGEKSIAIYIDALEKRSLDRALYVSRGVEIVIDILEDLNKRSLGSGIGKILAEALSDIVEKAIAKKKLEDSYVLVAVDDVVRAIGMDQIEWYVKWLYELLWKIYDEYRPRAINFVITTSEGLSLELIARHRHAGISLVWNLDKGSFEELFYALNPPNGIAFEGIWRLMGGNPGRLIELATFYRWDLERWFDDLVKKLKPIAIEIVSRGLVEELRLLIEDPDNVIHRASTKMRELYRILVEANLFMYKGISTLSRESIPRDTELGIGKDYAWQIPAYREALANILA